MKLSHLDVLVLVVYLAGTTVASIWMARRARTTEEYVHAGGMLPGWVVALSIFASYISSISYLANPSKSLETNWNPFLFSLMAPVTALIACWWVVPFYRRLGALSAYEMYEQQYGAWARVFQVVCYLLTQMSRTGMIIYLLALATAPLLGRPESELIFVIGALMVAASMLGGLPAIVWVGVVHSAVLALGPAICLVALLWLIPGGGGAMVDTAWNADKFSLGSAEFSFTAPTVWVLLAYGLVGNFVNFSVDQGYVQRYQAADSERAARNSVWWGAWIYTPVAGVFFLIGTALWAWLELSPGLLPPELHGEPKKVFPWFIATQLPPGLGGLVVAGVFAAALDPSLNSMAVLTFDDVYKRYLRPEAGDHEAVWVLRWSTLIWGAASVGVALAMTQINKQVLDVWWELAGVFGGAMLGLFLVARTTRAVGWHAAIAVLVGSAAIVWMTLTAYRGPTAETPSVSASLAALHNPLHPLMTGVVGSALIWAIGAALGRFAPARTNSPLDKGG